MSSKDLLCLQRAKKEEWLLEKSQTFLKTRGNFLQPQVVFFFGRDKVSCILHIHPDDDVMLMCQKVVFVNPILKYPDYIIFKNHGSNKPGDVYIGRLSVVTTQQINRRIHIWPKQLLINVPSCYLIDSSSNVCSPHKSLCRQTIFSTQRWTIRKRSSTSI